MNVVDGLVSNADELENLFLSINFPWFLVKKSSGKTTAVEGFTDTIQFEHHFIRDDAVVSPAIHSVMRLLDWPNLIKEIKVSPSILRMKSNLLLSTQKGANTPHVDMTDPHTVLLYYINDSSGPTTFYDNDLKVVKEVEPRKGRILTFNGSMLHSSTPPTSNEYRSVINFDLKHIE